MITLIDQQQTAIYILYAVRKDNVKEMSTMSAYSISNPCKMSSRPTSMIGQQNVSQSNIPIHNIFRERYCEFEYL